MKNRSIEAFSVGTPGSIKSSVTSFLFSDMSNDIGKKSELRCVYATFHCYKNGPDRARF